MDLRSLNPLEDGNTHRLKIITNAAITAMQPRMIPTTTPNEMESEDWRSDKASFAASVADAAGGKMRVYSVPMREYTPEPDISLGLRDLETDEKNSADDGLTGLASVEPGGGDCKIVEVGDVSLELGCERDAEDNGTVGDT
ncbi:hypothetical protein HDU81_004017 [Chytriomyces hyalinus]|nr:hypothetical protein HDU81_004017 [Chytriomyces hyalinus]